MGGSGGEAGAGSSPAPVADFVRQPVDGVRKNGAEQVYAKEDDQPRKTAAKESVHPVPFAAEAPIQPDPVVPPPRHHQQPAQYGGKDAKRQQQILNKTLCANPRAFMLSFGLLEKLN